MSEVWSSRVTCLTCAGAYGPFAVRLRMLFEECRRPESGERYTSAEVAARIAADGGPALTLRDIDELRTGRVADPAPERIEALAQFFGVSPMSFLSESAQHRLRADLDVLEQFPDPAVRAVVVRLAALGEHGRAVVAALIAGR